MLTNFKELEDYVLSRNMKKRIALANAHTLPKSSAAAFSPSLRGSSAPVFLSA